MISYQFKFNHLKYTFYRLKFYDGDKKLILNDWWNTLCWRRKKFIHHHQICIYRKKYGEHIILAWFFHVIHIWSQIFDEIIFRLLENGILTKWDKQCFNNENNNYVKVVMKKLKMDHLRVSFVCLLIFHGIPVGIFLLELIWYYYHVKVICQR